MKPTKYSLDGYTNKGQHISAEIIQQLDRYINRGEKPGDFLTAVLCDELMNAAQKANNDSDSLKILVDYIYFNLPPGSHGSVEIVNHWLNRFYNGKLKTEIYSDLDKL